MQTTDQHYNAEIRHIEQKIILHFSSTLQLEINRDNYLISSTLLEEAHSQSGSIPFGNVTSNEFSMELLNENGLFSPTNNESPYFGLMKKGLKLEVFIRPITEDNLEWDPLGIFYVSDWTAKVTGLVANITANDNMYNIFKKDLTYLPIKKDTTQKDFYVDIFNALKVKATVDEKINAPLRYAYVIQGTKELLSELNKGSIADCYCNHHGDICVKKLTGLTETRAVITDEDQIIDADIEQSILFDFDGVNVTYNLPQESEIQNVLSLRNMIIPVGESTRKYISLTGTPMFRLNYATIDNSLVTISKMSATANSIDITFNNTTTLELPDSLLEVFGICITSNNITIGKDNENALAFSNMYIQEANYANEIYHYLRAYIYNNLPLLELSIRGNPKLELGDVIQANSTKYKLNYRGILIKQELNYSGSLDSKITLLNTEILQEVANGV